MTKEEARKLVDDLEAKGIVKTKNEGGGVYSRDANVKAMRKIGVNFYDYFDAINLLGEMGETKQS